MSKLHQAHDLVRKSRPYEAYRAESPRRLDCFRRYRPRAGHPDWPKLQSEAKALADKLLPGLAPPESKLARSRRFARAYRTAVGNYLENRRRARAGREDLLPLYFIWTTLRTCNFTCTYCDDHRGRKYPELPNEGVLNTEQGLELLRIMRTRAPSVYFAGGEPMVRKDLPELTRAARDMGYGPIIINTNGSLIARRLADPTWSSWLADTDMVVVSIDSLDLESLRDMWVYQRPHEVLRDLLLLHELRDAQNFQLMVNTVIQPGRIRDAWDVLDLACDLGICFCPVPMNVAAGINTNLRDDPEYRALVKEILRRKRAGAHIAGSLRMLERLLNSAPLNCRNTLKPHIDFDGHLVWPCKSTQNTDPAYVQVLDYDDVDALYAEATRRIDPTNFHGPGPNQCGGNCNWAQNYTTDLYVHGLLHPASLARDVMAFLRGR